MEHFKASSYWSRFWTHEAVWLWSLLQLPAVFAILFSVAVAISSGAKLYGQNAKASQKASSHIRLRRQTHPASTIAKLPTQDNNAFVPIVGPTQSLGPQFPPFPQNDVFSNTIEFPNLQSVPNTLVDYLVPPSPDSPVTSLNFQDPAANLQNIDNVFDVTSPTSSPSNNLNTFNAFQNLFPPNFSNQNQQNLPASTTQSTFTNDQVQSISFQNPSQTSSSNPNIVPNPSPSNNINSFPGNANNFFSNKISNPLNREASSQLNSLNQFPSNQFNIPTPPSVNFPKSETPLEKPSQQSSQGKWELGYDANEILAPPRDDSFSRANDYDTINVAKFRRPNTNLSPPTGNTEQQVNQIQTPASQFFNSLAHPNNQFQPTNNQFSPSNSPLGPTNPHFGPFNPFSVASNAPTNDPFTPVSNQLPQNNQIPANQFAPNKENNEPSIIWGTQKQANFNPTTSAPFLPTIPPNTNSNGQQQPFQNVQPSNFQNFQNFQNSGFNPLPSTQQLQFQQPPLNNQQFFDLQNLNQNLALETPLNSQFDTILPQGTVSEHSFQPFNENGRHFQKKRQVNEEEIDEQPHSHYDEEPESKFKLKHAGPVYSFVKTDRDGHFKWSVRHPSKR